jgi:AcrR family transcriptional regulator
VANLKIRQSPKLPAEQRRQQLLESAHTLFLKRGIRATSTEDIARNAGLTKGALYFHFKNKEDILFELIKSIAHGYREAIEALPHGKLCPEMVIEETLNYKGKGKLRDFRGMVEIWMQAMSVPKIKRSLNNEFRSMVAYVAEGWDESLGLDRTLGKQVAIAVLCLADGLAAHRCLDESVIQPSAQIAMLKALGERVGTGVPAGKRTMKKAKAH